jgi:cyanophycin synthetase
MTGPYSARVVLRDPTVDFAVLETARGGILRAGLGFDRCDIGVVLNVGIDHLGLKDVETVEEMASVKSVVVENVEVNGYSVLNAQDPLVAAMASKARGQKVFFSTDPEHPVFRQHVREGGIGATADKGMLMITRGTLRLPIAEIYEIPITFNGRADFNVENCLASSLAAYVWGMKTEDIRAGLMTFTPTYAYNQGRMNLIPVKDFEVILDYCHNVSSYEAMKKFLSRVKAKRHIGVMGVPGDRRDEDIRSMATSVCQCFDHYVLRDDHLRGRKPGEVPALFAETLKANGVPEGRIETVLDEVESVTRGLELARKDDLLVVFVNKVEPVYHRIMEFKKAVENT